MSDRVCPKHPFEFYLMCCLSLTMQLMLYNSDELYKMSH